MTAPRRPPTAAVDPILGTQQRTRRRTAAAGVVP